MDTIDRTEAAARGMKSVTIDIDPVNERHIVESIEKAMRGIKAAWVRFEDGTPQLFRVRAELNPFHR